MATCRKVAVLVQAAGLMNGCAAWRYIPTERAATIIRETKPTRVRFAIGDSTVEVSNPSIVRDSLVGTVKRGDVKQKTSFALTSLDSLSVRSKSHTAGWIIVGAWATFVAAALISIPDPPPVK
jgi:hypothetical protein